MAGVSGGSLAYQTCRAGGLGFIAAGHLDSEKSFQKLEREIKIFRDLAKSSSSSLPLGIGFIGHSTFGEESPGWDFVQRILEEHRPESVQIFAPAISKAPSHVVESSPSYTHDVAVCQSYGCRVIAQVGSVKDGVDALAAGVDCLIAQGTEAGGHGIRRDIGNSTLSLTARLVRLAKEERREIPVLAAGGIVDGRGLVAALGLGADGVVLGTRLWASEEALGSTAYKNALVNAGSCDDVVRTRVFDTVWNSQRERKWPYPFDSSGTLRNDTTAAWDTSISALEVELNSDKTSLVEKLNHAEEAALPDKGCVYSGQGVGEIVSIEPAHDIVMQIEKSAIETLLNLKKVVDF